MINTYISSEDASTSLETSLRPDVMYYYEYALLAFKPVQQFMLH